MLSGSSIRPSVMTVAIRSLPPTGAWLPWTPAFAGWELMIEVPCSLIAEVHALYTVLNTDDAWRVSQTI